VGNFTEHNWGISVSAIKGRMPSLASFALEWSPELQPSRTDLSGARVSALFYFPATPV
jgi:hypothetical protein